jgi:hypothetical protein
MKGTLLEFRLVFELWYCAWQPSFKIAQNFLVIGILSQHQDGDHSKTEHKYIRFSNVSGIQMYGFRTFPVLNFFWPLFATMLWFNTNLTFTHLYCRVKCSVFFHAELNFVKSWKKSMCNYSYKPNNTIQSTLQTPQISANESVNLNCW